MQEGGIDSQQSRHFSTYYGIAMDANAARILLDRAWSRLASCNGDIQASQAVRRVLLRQLCCCLLTARCGAVSKALGDVLAAVQLTRGTEAVTTVGRRWARVWVWVVLTVDGGT